MSDCYEIYGYTCTKECRFDGYSITPVFDDALTVSKIAADKNNYRLTGWLRVEDDFNVQGPKREEFLFNLEGVLTFIERQDVIINRVPVEINSGNLDDKKFRAYSSRWTLGPLFSLNTDDIRSEIIFLLMCELEYGEHFEVFKTALFKTIEFYRMKKSYIDVDYYLLFSAIESLSRAHQNETETDNSVEKVLCCFIRIDCGFSSFSQNPSKINYTFHPTNKESVHILLDGEVRQLIESTSSYAHVRNALVHNGALYEDVNVNGLTVRFKLIDFYPYLRKLVPLVLIKYAGFSNKNARWDCWKDLFEFI